jgi:hypothetical protein
VHDRSDEPEESTVDQDLYYFEEEDEEYGDE